MRMIIILIGLILTGHLIACSADEIKGDGINLVRAVERIDQSCWQLKSHGACMVGDIPGVMISYYEPSLVIHTITRKASLNALSGGNLRFHDARVYDFPLKQIEQMVLCGSLTNTAVGLRYMSEMDSRQWRQETTAAREFVGNWGPVYPRTGFVNHYSPAASSALIALRGISAGGLMSGHISQAPILFSINRWQDKIQMVEPDQQKCMPLGQDPRFWMAKNAVGERSNKEEEFSWIFWRFMQCCKTAVPSSL